MLLVFFLVGVSYLLLLLRYTFTLCITLPVQIYQSFQDIISYLAGRLQDLHEFLLIAEKIEKSISADALLGPLLREQLQYTRSSLSATHASSPVHRPIRHFLTTDFSKWSVFSHSMATLLTSLEQIRTHGAHIHKVICEVGYVGTYVWSAQLLQSDALHKFSFVEIFDNGDHPSTIISFENFWNTGIDSYKVESNNAFLDSQRCRTLLIMGANKGGKTAYAIATIRYILLSQVLGIAPCNTGRIIPISFFYIHKSIQDDPASRKSMYRADLDKLDHEYIRVLRALHPEAKSVAFFDEFLRTIRDDEATALLISFLKRNTASFPNYINVLTTHNAMLMNEGMKTDKLFIVHPEALPLPDGSFKRTFRILEGPPTEDDWVLLFRTTFPDLPASARAQELLEEKKNA